MNEATDTLVVSCVDQSLVFSRKLFNVYRLHEKLESKFVVLRDS